ncbi:MAG: thioredoxin [Undibacterium sp.]|nr:thioredoxin [Opitutaceae bacterium]
MGTMKFPGLILALVGITGAIRAAELLPIEQQVAEAIKSPGVTVVHFWAPWCSNCAAELAKSGWSTFIDTNAEVKFIFVTTWHDEIGREVLAKNGVGTQSNFELLLHPNPSRKAGDRTTRFLGLPLTWVPSTWIFREGELRYALSYGEVRFPILQQLIRDTGDKW